MLEDCMHASMSNKKTYDNIREYCITEGVDEQYFRSSMKNEKQGKDPAAFRDPLNQKVQAVKCATSKPRKEVRHTGGIGNVMRKYGIKPMLIIITAAFVLISMSLKMENDVKNLAFAETDMSLIADGVYQGKAETTFVKAEVETVIVGHRIVNIRILKHDKGFGRRAEQITNDMILMNTFEVDVISGATASSKVIKSAVSDALAKGRVK